MGVIATTLPLEQVYPVLHKTGKAEVRERPLPTHLVVFFVVTLAVQMQSSCHEVLRCLLDGLRVVAYRAEGAGRATSLYPR